MTQRRMRHIGFGLTVSVIVASIAILNVGVVANTAAAECRDASGGGGSPSASPSGSATPSGSSTGGGLPINPSTLLGDESETPTPSGSGSPPGGDSEPQRCPTRLTIDYERSSASSSATDFFGAVKSPADECERGRQVLLKKDRKSGRDRTVGSTVSKRNGRWRIREPRARGRYYAQARKRNLSGSGIVCQGDRSKTIRV